MIFFSNDPAREGRKESVRDPHPEVCFQILLDDLLVLGLGVGAEEDIPASLVDVVPDWVAENPQFRAQMIQQNFFFRETSAGVTAICKKKNADNGFTLAFTKSGPRGEAPNLVGAVRLAARRPKTAAAPAPPAPPAARAAARKGAAPPPAAAPAAIVNPNAAYPADPVAACQLKNPGVPETSQDAALGLRPPMHRIPKARSSSRSN